MIARVEHMDVAPATLYGWIADACECCPTRPPRPFPDDIDRLLNMERDAIERLDAARQGVERCSGFVTSWLEDEFCRPLARATRRRSHISAADEKFIVLSGPTTFGDVDTVGMLGH